MIAIHRFNNNLSYKMNSEIKIDDSLIKIIYNDHFNEIIEKNLQKIKYCNCHEETKINPHPTQNGEEITELAKNIFFVEKPNTPQGFLSKVQDAISKISSGPVGSRLLNKIGAGNHKVQIAYDESENQCTPIDSFVLGSFEGNRRVIGKPSIIYLSNRVRMVFNEKLETIEQPFFLTVAHELIHAMHISFGKNTRCFPSPNDTLWTNDEEYKTIRGKEKPYRSKPTISENSIRGEHNLPTRFTHFGITKCLH